MAFIEKQRHGNHDYFYLVKSVRVSPTKVTRARVFLGREVPGHAELQKIFVELEKKIPAKILSKHLSKELVEKLEDLRASIKQFHETPVVVLPKDFLVRFTYNSNAIEGNPLTLRQTALILSDQITPQGAKTEDVVEVLNGKDAWEFVKNYGKALNKSFVCKTQFEVTKNTSCTAQGSYRITQVGITGSDWKPPLAEKVEGLMEEFIKEFKESKRELHPIELASFVHNKLAQIHAFSDGNGRTARLLMNWVLLRNGFPPAVVEASNKEEYYACIEKADAGDDKAFSEFLGRQLLKQYTLPKTIPEEKKGG